MTGNDSSGSEDTGAAVGHASIDTEEDQSTRQGRSVTLRMRSDGILHGIALPDLQQTLEDARKNVAIAEELSGGGRAPLLMDVRSTGTLSREARACYTGEEGARVISALALLADSAFARAAGNLIIRLAKSNFPARLFATESEALQWLRQYK